jgi:hypothetical protein
MLLIEWFKACLAGCLGGVVEIINKQSDAIDSDPAISLLGQPQGHTDRIVLSFSVSESPMISYGGMIANQPAMMPFWS